MSLLTVLSLNAAAKDKSAVDVSHIRLEKRDSLVHLSFDVVAGRHSTKEFKLITPTIKGRHESKDFTPVGIVSRRIQLLALRDEQRNEIPQAYAHYNGSSFSYVDSIPYEDWMNGGKLVLNFADNACCKLESAYAEVKMNPVVLLGEAKQESIPQKQSVKKVNVVTDNRAVYFAQGKAELNNRLYNNHDFINEISGKLTQILSDANNQLVSIEINGYASPEGGYQSNMQLSCDRAHAVKDHLMKNIPELSDSLFLLNCMGENWDDLQNRILASDMPYRNEVLAIFANTTMDDGGVARKNALRKLKNGIPYQYLLHYFYPDLRNARNITITYISTEEEDPVIPDNDSEKRKNVKQIVKSVN